MKVEHVEEDKGILGDVREALIIMASTPDSELNVGAFCAYYSGLDVRFLEDSDNE